MSDSPPLKAEPKQAHLLTPPKTQRQWLRFILFGRIFPALLFAFMGWLQAIHISESIQHADHNNFFWSIFKGTIPLCLYFLFSAIPVFIYLTRSFPKARDGRLIPRIMAFGGTVFLVVVGAFSPNGTQLYSLPNWTEYLITPLLIVVISVSVIGVLYLRRNLSIIPEARQLVTSGPYKFIRHPLYFSEVTSALILAFNTGRAIPIIAALLEIGFQYTRLTYEERLLTSVFPEYLEYAKRTKRFIPFIL